ncbi:hypothetical protein GUJ93_ZPchr0012g20381 [Zizania palustris]|uniref:VQ domain-containing protein n=1 Tax=Zizania palustris TaxID=103762 RepID=A0A8J5RDE5_ZIZPA|nr:hypothetical protein GUJ93_ZPchr0029g29031 [Zizania palustris]KAG8094829.1 hypothetical protein GUJ93_ZPchr0012g20381 [Zizania palustris]
MGEYNSMSPSSTPWPAQKDSSGEIPKGRPKIKIIHIIAPEIINTDVANFRELVQRLTGKNGAAADSSADAAPPLPVVLGEEERQKKVKTTAATAIKKKRPAEAAVVPEMSEFMGQDNSSKKKIKCEVKVEEGGFGYDLDRSELWSDLTPGGFLSFLEEDVYFQDMAADFLLPVKDGFCW